MEYSEKKRVMEHSQAMHYSDMVMQKTTKYCGMIFRRFMVNGSVLELGPAEGVMTDVLCSYFDDYTVVDGVDYFVEEIEKRHPKIKGYASLFEDFVPDQKYNNIVLGHVLEHVENPVEILKMCGTWLSDNGCIVAAVPNAKSIHRQAAVLMGLLETEYQLNEQDEKNGHRRVYDMDSLKNDFIKADYEIITCGGYWFKPVSNAQINENWNEKMIDSFLRLGEKYPDISGEIYIIANKKHHS